jgi:autotransporter-associated beta strand protein
MSVHQISSAQTISRRGQILALAVASVISGTTSAVEIYKLDNADALNVNTAWVDGASAPALPGSSDIAVWDSRIVSGPLTNSLGANATWGGIKILNPAGAGTINGAFTLTLGVSGINMTNATQDLNYYGVTGTGNSRRGLTLASGVQQWNVADGRTLTMDVVPSRNNGANNSGVGGILQIGTTGTVKFNNYMSSASNAITINAVGTAVNLIWDGGRNPFVTYGKNDWAGLDATGKVIASTYTQSSGGVTGGGVINVDADYTTATIDVEAVRFSDELEKRTATVTGTHTVRGILMTDTCAGGTFSGGTIRPSRNSTAGVTMSIIQHSTTGDLFIGSAIGNGSSSAPTAIAKSGAGRVIYGGANGNTGQTFIHEGTLQVGNGGTSGQIGGTAAVNNNAALILNRSDALTVANIIAGAGSLEVAGTGVTTLSGVNTYTGLTNLNAGTTLINAASGFGNGTALNINNAAVRFGGAADLSTKTVTMSGNATLDTNAQSITFASGIGNSGSGSLTKTGAGTLVLQGNNTYTGGTAVNAGALRVNNAAGIGVIGNVTVNATATLGGAGTISGSTTVNSGGTLSPGASVGTLHTNTLTLESGSMANWEFGASVNDLVVVDQANGLTLNGGAFAIVAENSGDAPFASVGTYNLIQYSGSVGGGTSNLSVSNMQPGKNYAFSLDGSHLKLTISTAAVFSNWITNGSGTWTDGANWSGAIPNGVQETANFNTDLTNGPATVNMNGAKTLGAVIFQSPSNGYTLSGGSLTLNNGASQSGISVLSGNHTIAVPVAVAGSAGLIIDTAINSSVTLGDTLSGSAQVIKNGAGAAILAGSNSFSNGLYVNNGTIGVAHNNALGSGMLFMLTTGNLRAETNVTIGNNIQVEGGLTGAFDTQTNTMQINGDINGGGGLIKNGNGTLIINGNDFAGANTVNAGTLQLGTGGTTGATNSNITNNGVVVFRRSDDITFGNLISGTGMLVKVAGNMLTLANANTFSGDTQIAGGTLLLGTDLAIQSSTLDYNNLGGVLDFGNLTIATFGGLKGSQNLQLLNNTAGTIAFSVGANSQTTTYAGNLTGEGSTLTKVGTGTLVLTGASTLTTGVTVSAGQINVATLGALQADSLTVTPGAPSGKFVLSGGSVSLTGLLNLAGSSAGGNLGGLVTAGTLNAAGVAINTGNATQNIQLKVEGGVVTVGTITAGRSGTTVETEPAAAPTSCAVYVAGGQLNVSGALGIGNTNNTNSNQSMLIEGGEVNVGGELSLSHSHGARWGIIDIAGGVLNSTDTLAGVRLGGSGTHGGGNNILQVRGTGVANVERIQFGTGSYTGNQIVSVNGGTLFVGSGGIVAGSTGSTNSIRLTAGTLGSTADWSSDQPLDLRNVTATAYIRTSDASNIAHTITLSGIASGTGGFNKTGAGTLTLSGANTYTGNTTVSAGTLFLAPAAANIVVTGAAGAVLNGGKLVIDYTGGSSPKATLVDHATLGLAANAAGGHIAGQLRTSTANATKAIGWLDDGSTTFQARYTYKGDVNLSGTVDSTDFNAFVALGNYGMTSGAIWANGDFDYNGKVNTMDFNDLAGNFGAAALPAPVPGATLGSVVPEPSTLGLIGIAAMGLISRRRRA